MNRLVASLYFPHWSPIAAFKLVYKGSRSMRGTELEALGVFWVGNELMVLLLLMTRVFEGCDIESWRLKAAGSISGMMGAGRNPRGMGLLH